MDITGKPPDRCTSTVISGASTPTQARLNTCANPTKSSLVQMVLKTDLSILGFAGESYSITVLNNL